MLIYFGLCCIVLVMLVAYQDYNDKAPDTYTDMVLLSATWPLPMIGVAIAWSIKEIKQ